MDSKKMDVKKLKSQAMTTSEIKFKRLLDDYNERMLIGYMVAITISSIIVLIFMILFVNYMKA